MIATLFADRMTDVPKSFIREILKISLDPEIISFAGGLPNKDLFPTEALRVATEKVFRLYGSDCLQYAGSEGSIELRELIARRYRRTRNIDIDPRNILILNGAQQGLDLLGKIFLNSGDTMAVEEPGYLGALQAFTVYQPEFHPFPVGEQGVDLACFREAVVTHGAKLVYVVPNFQNPSGISYSADDRRRMCDILRGRPSLLIEDDPYGELRFQGEALPSFYSILPEQTILLGSFSKTVIPGFRIGWIVASADILEKVLVAKQAADLHTCHFTQHILRHYLLDNDIDAHIGRVVDAYGRQCRAMIAGLEQYLPDSISFTRPQGGMFLWGKLPEGHDSMQFFDHAVREKVVFVPGAPFFVRERDARSFRLSFSCVDGAGIEEGMRRLGRAASSYFSARE